MRTKWRGVRIACADLGAPVRGGRFATGAGRLFSVDSDWQKLTAGSVPQVLKTEGDVPEGRYANGVVVLYGCDENPSAFVEFGSLEHTFVRSTIQRLPTREASAFLGLSPRTLDRYRVTGEGPTFFKFGSRVRYLKTDVEAWAQSRRRRSTSDNGLTRAT